MINMSKVDAPSPSWDRRCLLVDLQDDHDLITEYERWHRPGGPPAAVTRSLRATGVAQMEIFRAGDRLVMIIDIAPEFDADARAAAQAVDPEIQAWERLMDRFQKRLPWAGTDEKWVVARSIYRLSDQPDGGGA